MKRDLFILVLALQSAWVLCSVALQERGLQVGAVVLLETRSVHPGNLLRDNHLFPAYMIGDFPATLFSPPLTTGLSYGDVVWVALAPRGEFHEVVRAGTHRFEVHPGEVLVQGKVIYATRDVRVEYGLERYYVREGTGNPRGTLTVQAVVPASGRASIKQVFLDGKPYAEAMKENPH